MLFKFCGFTLDRDKRELRCGDVVPVQPQVLDILIFLIENRARVVSKDDLIGSVWSGRAISDSALTTRMNAVRRVVGDSGGKQQIVRTVARRGFRFVAEVREVLAAQVTTVAADNESPQDKSAKQGTESVGSQGNPLLRARRRASVAVLPFTDLSPVTPCGIGTADGLVHDVITRLAKLRGLFVIAQGTVFALRDGKIESKHAGRMLSVDYLVNGSLRRSRQRLTVSIELIDVSTSQIVWAEAFARPLGDLFLIVDEISDAIVASIASEIETFERNRAILKPPGSLDAWEAHHRALWHMYRFNREDNEHAQRFFEKAISLDPTFSRAHAGLSFVHWQNAFQGWKDRKAETERAYAAAGQSLFSDDRDPAAHWAMGRALWLRGLVDSAIAELSQATDLSPSFAQAHYSLGFVHATTGNAESALSSADYTHRLSPFDPMLFANHAVRAMALSRLGRFDEAANWAASGAARPNAHVQIIALAAYTAALAGRGEEARNSMAQAFGLEPNYRIDDFLTAMHLGTEGETLFRKAAALIGK